MAIADSREEDAHTQAVADYRTFMTMFRDFNLKVSLFIVKDGITKDGELTTLGFGCDVACEESVRTTVKQVDSQPGLVDTLIEAAGIVPALL
jgi:NAD(P)-dependent dehydrogenase (short-subunit alcohol dehydrogenase family)